MKVQRNLPLLIQFTVVGKHKKRTSNVNKTYQGTVKFFNGQFGFLKSELGDTYFNKSGIVGNISIDKGDEVEFKTEPSLKKEGSLQCCEITLIKKFEKPSIQLVNP